MNPTAKPTTLHALLNAAGITFPPVLADHAVSAVTDNSRHCEPGCLFVAQKGPSIDSHLFISDAISQGARTVIVQSETPPYDKAQILRVPDSRDTLGRIAHAWNANPSASLTTVAVTGTNGKTTTVQMLEAILGACVGPCGVMGTIEHRLGQWRESAQNTTPGAIKLAALAATMASKGAKALALEASSHALDQRRVSGLQIDAAILLNITPDHLDYHGTMEAYAEAKGLLFLDHLLRKKSPGKPDPIAAIFVDDQYCRAIADQMPPHARTLRLSTQRPLGPDVDLCAKDIIATRTGIAFQIQCGGTKGLPKFDHPVTLPVAGLYNAANALAALAVAVGLDIDPLRAIQALSAMPPVPGRLQPVRLGQAFEVLVDYAHTPDALENSLRNARAICAPGGKLIVVFGCGGDRDRTKRPLMGRIAIRLADNVIVTDDNPRTEPSAAIIEEILHGVREGDTETERHAAIPDRATAIRTAIGLANPGDVVLIAGKGHETYQEVDGRRTHFDDVEQAAIAIKDGPWNKTPQ